jgi:uridine monophosphate synthetase
MTKLQKEKLALALYQAQCIKFGEFVLKSGMKSPVYIDLRVLVSYPKIMNLVGKAYTEILKNIRYDRLAAVPYTALPITSVVSLLTNKPWIYTRKEAKKYGIQKPAEGLYNPGETIVIIDDMVTTGASKLEVIESLSKLDLRIKTIVVLVDRQQGAKEQLAKKGYRLKAAINISDLLTILKKKNKIDQAQYDSTIKFLKLTKI